MKIRNYKEDDNLEIYKLFYNTVHYINCRHYNKEQLDIWAKDINDIDLATWAESLSSSFSLVAELNDKIVGFSAMDKTGLLNMLYVHKDYQAIGIARELLNNIYSYAKTNKLEKITSYVSITAKPLFIKSGYTLIGEHMTTINNINFKNYIFEKYI